VDGAAIRSPLSKKLLIRSDAAKNAGAAFFALLPGIKCYYVVYDPGAVKGGAIAQCAGE
jgi:hypothetical protein